jgi:polyisoprenoid-binding protein YceI
VRISGETKVDRSQFGLGWNRLGVISPAATIAADAIFVRAPR